MPERKPIQVPDRGDDEPPASAEQLQFIRQLVTGMSLRGFRFDYRKLGTVQAASIIDQLIQIRDATGAAPPRTRRGGGCVGSFFRGAWTLVIAAAVLAGIAGGGYLIWENLDTRRQTDKQTDAGDAANEPTGAIGEVEMFPGLGDGGTADPPAEQPAPPRREIEPEPAPLPTPTPTPASNPERIAAAGQVPGMEKVLVQLSQATRGEYPLGVRQTVRDNMLKRVEEMDALATVIQRNDPELLDRVRTAIRAYAAEPIDGASIRGEVDALRERLRAVAESLR